MAAHPDILQARDRAFRLIGPRRIRHVMRFLEACRYGDWRVWNLKHSFRVMDEALRSGEPQAIGKLGSFETAILRRHLLFRPPDGRLTFRARALARVLSPEALFFSDSTEEYCRFMLRDVLPEMTVLGVWFNTDESVIVKRFAPRAQCISFLGLETYGVPYERWTRLLAGKRVLVVSMFSASIGSQYARRKEIWGADADTVLPEFNLRCVRAPNPTPAGGQTCREWFATLQDMKDRMAAAPFDVALIGAGPFSLPLVVHAKRLGGVGIHLGGSIQLYFGIKGARWERNALVTRFYNDAWVRPSVEETPGSEVRRQNDDGCYW